MSWKREWKSIKENIGELTVICNEYIAALSVNNSDSYGTIKNIIVPMARGIAHQISNIGQRYESQLPKEAIELLKEFSEKTFPCILGYGKNSTTDKLPSTIAHITGLLRKFKSEFDYLTSDLEGVAVRQTARAFSHLQRSIVADESAKDKWVTAFQKNEEACEKLGSIHLLLHGIWSFKVNSVGERTDLVLGEPLRDDNLSEVFQAAEGLVLTEWKRSSNVDGKNKFEEALNQARLYAKGSLASIELKRYRYLVVVSEQRVDVPDDIEIDGIIYKHINIAVDPLSPSQAAKVKRT